MKKTKLGSAIQQILGLAVGVTLLPSLAMAQQAEADAEAKQKADDKIEVISVMGIRRSMETTIDIKKNEASIVEAVSAEDIGKLPDQSIAESLTRLPGLAGQRVNGRVQVISIRGLAPDFSTTTLNGRHQASAGDNRAVEYDQYPSELINGAVVYKTSDLSIAGMGLSGTVDMRTIRPLAHGEQTVMMNLRGEKSSFDQMHPEVSANGWRGCRARICRLICAWRSISGSKGSERLLRNDSSGRENTRWVCGRKNEMTHRRFEVRETRLHWWTLCCGWRGWSEAFSWINSESFISIIFCNNG